jgi:hypothetical protein
MTRLTHLIAAGLLLGATGLALPALGQSDHNAMTGPHGMMRDMPNRGMKGGMMGRGMMERGMAENCMQMMGSMQNGDYGRPNEQWRPSSPPAGRQ